MRALAFKELRETRGIAAVALGCYLVLVASLLDLKAFAFVPGIPATTTEIPFVGTEFIKPYIWITLVFAATLGFWQSVGESTRGTFLFLLHRPVSPDGIVLTKLATGLAVLGVCGAVPVVLYAWWAGVPGHFPGPFEWSMTASAWKAAAVFGPSFYLGAFLSGIRPARWYGTRLLPLIALPGGAFLLSELPATRGAMLPLVGLLYAATAGTVCFVARVRDYA
jgi:hypothetical protein